MPHTSFQEAREQASDYLGFARSEIIKVGDKTFEIPNPSLLDDEQQDRVDALDVEMDEKWDRYPEVKDEYGNVHRGALKVPHRKNGKPVNYNRELAKALFGDGYKAFVDAGGRANDVALIWTRMRQETGKRRDDDSKSGGSDSNMAAVPESD